jgi:Tol biopolymer transport system component
MDEDDPFIEPDGLTLWFNVAGGIVRSTRPDRMSAWSTPVPVLELDSAFNEDAPGFTADGLTVYFDSDRTPTLGLLDLWSATRPTRTSPFSNLRHEVVASSNSFDCCAHVLPGETQVAFTTQRAGSSKVYVADRLADGSLGPATPYALVNTSARDFDVFATPDGTTVGVSSDRMQTGDVDLWLYERSCP